MGAKKYKNGCLGGSCPIKHECFVAKRNTNDVQWLNRPMYKLEKRGVVKSCETRDTELIELN